MRRMTAFFLSIRVSRHQVDLAVTVGHKSATLVQFEQYQASHSKEAVTYF